MAVVEFDDAAGAGGILQNVQGRVRPGASESSHGSASPTRLPLRRSASRQRSASRLSAEMLKIRVGQKKE